MILCIQCQVVISGNCCLSELSPAFSQNDKAKLYTGSRKSGKNPFCFNDGLNISPYFIFSFSFHVTAQIEAACFSKYVSYMFVCVGI